MKRFLFVVLLLSFSCLLVADEKVIEKVVVDGVTYDATFVYDPVDEVTINGVKYAIYTRTAHVVSYNPGNQYDINLEIPSEIHYNGKYYPVTMIENNVFRNCNKIVSITIPGTIQTLEDGSFTACNFLRTIKVSASNAAFCSIDGVLFKKQEKGLRLLQYPIAKEGVSYTIPNGVTSIGESAFWGCYKLTSVTIPSTLEAINTYAFVRCNNLTVINVYKNKDFYSIDGVLFMKKQDGSKIHLIRYPNKEATNYIIPDGVTELIPYAFLGSYYLTSITIPSTVTKIWENAFEGCTSLTSIVIPNSVNSIGENAFLNCDGLKYVKYPASLDLSKAGIPSTVRLIPYQGVDFEIPISSSVNDNTIVLIIANENYKNMPVVLYAYNDGSIFKEYCNKTLGIPQENIISLSDATLNDIRHKIDLLQKKVQARSNAKKETNIIVYYTGHGVPDGNTRSAYLMPIDGYEEDVTTGYKLDNLYQQLGQLPAKSITVFLDACFSGVNRNDEALAQHKGARLVAKSGMPTGNMVVFAASQGNQTAFVNDKEQHGLFTYYLLKKLQDSKGDVTLDDLANYLTTEVNLKSLDLHEKEQIPSIIASPQVQNQWQNWKLK